MGTAENNCLKSPSNWETFCRVMRLLKPYRLALIAVGFLSLLSVGATVLGPWIVGQATNLLFAGYLSSQVPASVPAEQAAEYLRSQGNTNLAQMAEATSFTPGGGIDFSALLLVIILAAGAYAMAGLMSLLAGITVRKPVQKLGYHLRQDIQRQIDRLPLSYLDHTARGDTLSRVGNDVDNLIQTLSQSITQVITSTLTLIGTASAMLYLSWRLSIISFVLLPVGLVLTVILVKRSAPQFARQWTQTGEVSSQVEDAFSGHQVMVAYGLEPVLAKRFSRANTALFNAAYRAQFLSGMVRPVMMFFSNLSFVALAVLGSIFALHGSITIGMVQAFLQYSRQLGQPIEELAGMANVFQSAIASAQRIFEFLDAEQMDPEDEGQELAATPISQIEFRAVNFAYTPGQSVINCLNLRVKRGQTIAIVGPTGAGKTTLVNLLMRFYEINGGEILVNGKDFRQFTKASLRAHFGMVLQDTWLFNGTIAENIEFGSPGATRDQIEQAGRASSVDDMIRSLPNGYDTVIGEEGEGISAGQKQLITIARAFLANRDVLILDEATSNVDTRTEVQVQKAMAKLRLGKTAFIIAHRLSTIRDADLIVVVEGGDIVEQGTHEELLALPQGAYTRLYRSQLQGSIEPSN